MMKTQEKKTFAFQLAARQAKTDGKRKQWQVRDGVAVAGCTGPDARESIDIWGTPRGRDKGYYC